MDRPSARISPKLTPVVGYQGGKRRLLPRLRPYFEPRSIGRYIEPFVGMGALYLDLRGSGYGGPAILADSHPQVASFWRMVHDTDAGRALVEAATAVAAEPRTEERYYSMLSEAVEDGPTRIARFLWLTNFAFANVPTVYEGDHWNRLAGTKLKSAAKWNKTFPWDKCVERLEMVVVRLADTPTTVLDSASAALAWTTDSDYIYADPPYVNQRRYVGAEPVDYVTLLNSARGRAVLSEAPGVPGLGGWDVEIGAIVARASGGVGATGKRSEIIYARGYGQDGFPATGKVPEAADA